MSRPARAQDRLLVRDGWKHYRRSYSLAEVRWGFAVLAVLIGIVAWVGWRGQQADPEIYGAVPLQGGIGAAHTTGDRGPVPTTLAPAGWSESDLSDFDADTLYVKINGRADFFLTKGFEHLFFISLVLDEDPSVTIDIEMYDMGTSANAIGVFNAERRKEVEIQSSPAGIRYSSRNALFVARSKFYVRAIGSEESKSITDGLAEVAANLESGIEADTLPWAYDLFVGQLELQASQVSYQTQNAFSLEFARDVYIARLEGDLQLFVIALDSEASATQMAGKLVEGFLTIGAPDGDGAPQWGKDEFIGTFGTAATSDRFVVGVLGAPDRATGQKELARLRKGLAELSPETLQRAMPNASAPLKKDSDQQADEQYDGEPGE
jgi:hypothetical protein